MEEFYPENEPAYDANNIELCDACNYTFSKNGIHYDKKEQPTMSALFIACSYFR